MKKNYIKMLIIVLIFSLFFLISCLIYLNINQSNKICIEDKTCFVVEIADDSEEMTRGLSGRESLDENEGMLFIFQKEITPSFWMKNMKFSIDIIWINEEKTVIKIDRNLNPCFGYGCPIFSPSQPAKYVLEINSNSSLQHDISEGDKINFRN